MNDKKEKTKNNLDLDLNLPDWSNTAKEPKYTAMEMAAICEKFLPYWNKQRYKKKLPLPKEPFVLK